MNWALTWVFLAAAILLSGRGAARGSARGSVRGPVRGSVQGAASGVAPGSVRGSASSSGDGDAAGRDQPWAKPPRELSPRAVRVGGGCCVALACVAMFGLRGGAVAALALGPITGILLGRLADRPSRTRPDASLALALDLAAVALRSGQTVATALVLAAPALTARVAGEWRRTASLLALGADSEQAWASMADDPVLAPVAVTARRSAHSGARLARAFSQLAIETRASMHAAAISRANRAGVLAMAPLGLCFLPAFVCLGIVPTVAGIAGDVLSAVP